MSNENRTCSFCGKSKQHVKHLIEGENAFICDECVSNCIEILHED
ncbi:TPA: ClpX C4-type zinc finger protein, partial [Neisseria meningitidis]